VVNYFSNLGLIVQSSGLVDCSLAQMAGSVNFGFEDPATGNGVIIAVPFSEMAIKLSDGTCELGLEQETLPELFFGDTFMRSAYIVYDFDSGTISLAQSSFNAASSNIIPIGG
jgi:Eukaryotic aspartyl protease